MNVAHDMAIETAYLLIAVRMIDLGQLNVRQGAHAVIFFCRTRATATQNACKTKDDESTRVHFRAPV